MELKTYEDQLAYICHICGAVPPNSVERQIELRSPESLEAALLAEHHDIARVKEVVRKLSLEIAAELESAARVSESILFNYEVGNLPDISIPDFSKEDIYEVARLYMWQFGPKQVVQDARSPEDVEKLLLRKLDCQEVKECTLQMAIAIARLRQRGINTKDFGDDLLYYNEAFPEDTE